MSGLYSALAIGGGALLSAGGTVAGGILSKPDDPKQVLPQGFNPASLPLNALSTLDLLASLGLFSPESVLPQAGPLQQVVNQFRANVPATFRYPNGVKDFLAGKDSAGARLVARQGGFNSVAEAHAAQAQFDQNIAPRLAELQQIATLSGSRQVDVERQLREIAANPLSLTGIRDAELARLNRQLDERQTSALRSASTGGFNPGRQLEGIENLRSDADLDALTRAVSLLAGQGQSIQNLNALNPANRAQQFGVNVTGQSAPQFSQAGFFPQTPDPFAASVAQASNQFGGTISSLGLLQLYDREKPAT